MAKYRVGLHAYANATVIVEADDEESAIDRSYEEFTGTLCVQCSGYNQDWSVDLGDFEVDNDEEFGGVVYKAVELVEE